MARIYKRSKSTGICGSKTAEIYEDQAIAVRLASGEVFVPLRPIVERLGLDWASQTRRITRDLILSKEQKRVVVKTTDSRLESMMQVMLCLPLNCISGFLFGVNASRVKPEIRDRLIRRLLSALPRMARRLRLSSHANLLGTALPPQSVWPGASYSLLSQTCDRARRR